MDQVVAQVLRDVLVPRLAGACGRDGRRGGEVSHGAHGRAVRQQLTESQRGGASFQNKVLTSMETLFKRISGSRHGNMFQVKRNARAIDTGLTC